MLLVTVFSGSNPSICLLEPLLLSCASKDVAFESPARRAAIDILQSQNTPYQVQLFSGVEHGFALRGDVTIPYDRKLISPNGPLDSLSYIYMTYRIHEAGKLEGHGYMV